MDKELLKQLSTSYIWTLLQDFRDKLAELKDIPVDADNIYEPPLNLQPFNRIISNLECELNNRQFRHS